MGIYPIITLKRGRERSVLHKHPWVFSGAVYQCEPAADGDIVTVKDINDNVLGYGFYAPHSQIIVKMFEFSAVYTDYYSVDYWQKKIYNALQLRNTYVINDQTNTYRLIHAEGDGMPGVIADVYAGTVVLNLLTKGVENICSQLTEALANLGFNNIYLKVKGISHEKEKIVSESAWLKGKSEMPVMAKENVLKFWIDIEKGQKTGFFIDQREHRRMLQMLCKGKTVLNTFSYTGGFSVYAIQGEAASVVSVDISKDAIQKCEENIALNFTNHSHHIAIAEDCFEYLKKCDTKYDIVILDPPAFAKNARSVPNACRGYKELNMLGIKACNAKGLIFTFSCSQNIDKRLFQQIVFSAAADVGRHVRIIAHLCQPADHPVNIYHPESEYLKGLLLYVD
ncbi:MAG: class I SAM-dependent rRNA methyltransferase [Cytophagales bacterium]|nr:class I SAM-dependent rRNA methyltransferase [Cytophagales bacterium]